MDLTSGRTFSVTRYEKQNSFSSLHSNIKCDILILGGGISGALAAHSLVKLGLDCVVVDKREIGMGSTCASTSMLLYELDDPIVKLGEKIGIQKADRIYKVCTEAVYHLEETASEISLKKFQRRKSLYFTGSLADKEMMNEEYLIRKKLGFEVSFLTADELMQKFRLAAEAAILSECGAQTDAYLFTHALLEFNRHKMCGVFSNTTIVNLDFQQNKIVALTKEGNTITAKHVIHATGYESQEYLPPGLVALRSTYVTCGKKHPDATDFGSEAVYWNSANPYLYIRGADDMIMVGGEDEDFYNPQKRDELLEVKERTLLKKFHELFPSLPLKPEYSWCGTFGDTLDGMPYIDTYGDKRNHFMLGFGGNGIVFSHIAAEILSYKVQGKPHSLTSYFSFER